MTFQMNLKSYEFVMVLVFVCLSAGCATTLPQRAAPEKDSAIVEEDIKEGPRDESTSAPEPVPPEAIGPPAPPAEQPPPLTGPVDRPPRRFIWKDQKGSGRRWEPAPQ